MELAVNLLWCLPGAVGGSEEYLTRQLLGLADAAPDLAARTTLFVIPEFRNAHPELIERFAVEVAPFAVWSKARRLVGEANWLRRMTKASTLTHHAGGVAPIGARHPYVLTIHDLQYLTFPEHFSRVKLAYYRTSIPRSAGGARVVAVPSEYVRNTVVANFHLQPERVRVVPHGVDPSMLTDVAPEPKLRARYRLGDGPFVVFPAVTFPHKNHQLLVDLLAGPWRGSDVRVVCCGAVGAAEDVVGRCADPRLIRLGRVPAADRNGLIAAAKALVFPSTYEGFGAPVIEAMALGTPVISSDCAALPEVVGNAGLLLPPTVEAWADALQVVETRRDELVAAGRARVGEFSAHRSGEALAEVYRQGEDSGAGRVGTEPAGATT